MLTSERWNPDGCGCGGRSACLERSFLCVRVLLMCASPRRGSHAPQQLWRPHGAEVLATTSIVAAAGIVASVGRAERTRRSPHH